MESREGARGSGDRWFVDHAGDHNEGYLVLRFGGRNGRKPSPTDLSHPGCGEGLHRRC